MNRKLPLIEESREEWPRRLKAERDVQKRQRLQALYRLSSGQVQPRGARAALLAVPRHSIGTWLAA